MIETVPYWMKLTGDAIFTLNMINMMMLLLIDRVNGGIKEVLNDTRIICFGKW